MSETKERLAAATLPGFSALTFGVTILAAVLSAGVTYGTMVTLGAESGKEQSRFEKATTDRFEAGMKDRLAHEAAIYARLDTVAAAMGARLDLLAATMNARFESIDRRDEARNDRVGAIDGRLNRIEAQLAFLVQTAGGGKR